MYPPKSNSAITRNGAMLGIRVVWGCWGNEQLWLVLVGLSVKVFIMMFLSRSYTQTKLVSSFFASGILGCKVFGNLLSCSKVIWVGLPWFTCNHSSAYQVRLGIPSTSNHQVSSYPSNVKFQSWPGSIFPSHIRRLSRWLNQSIDVCEFRGLNSFKKRIRYKP